MFKNYSYSTGPCAKKNSLKKQQDKKCKYKCIINCRRVNMPLKSINWFFLSTSTQQLHFWIQNVNFLTFFSILLTIRIKSERLLFFCLLVYLSILLLFSFFLSWQCHTAVYKRHKRWNIRTSHFYPPYSLDLALSNDFVSGCALSVTVIIIVNGFSNPNSNP